MLEQLDLDRALDKSTYKDELETLMRQLRSLQQACWQAKRPAIVVLEGWAAAGKGALVKKIVGYMDPRGFAVHPIWPATAEEQKYPFLWRFWQKLPARGSLSIFYHSWYVRLLEDRLFDRLKKDEVETAIAHINAFERQQVEDGTAIVKVFVHLSHKELKRRLKKYAKDELSAWRVRPEDWQQEKHYKKYRKYAEQMLAGTDTEYAPWTLVAGDDRRWAKVKVLRTIAATLTATLEGKTKPSQFSLPQTNPNRSQNGDRLKDVDLALSFEKSEYKQQLKQAQVELCKLQQKIYTEGIPVLILFEGWDAAGKGGTIKRLTDVLDPRSYQVSAFAAPTDEEKAHQYLWRFWRRLPAAGTIGIFDRTWYGRLLVERVEGFATETEWQRAYREINEFEQQLTAAGYVLVKFWLHISPEEQLQRFEARQNNPFKQYKLTEEDWRNREKWAEYERAVNDAIARTDTSYAPWTIVPGNDKYYARVMAIETVVAAIQLQIRRC